MRKKGVSCSGLLGCHAHPGVYSSKQAAGQPAAAPAVKRSSYCTLDFCKLWAGGGDYASAGAAAGPFPHWTGSRAEHASLFVRCSTTFHLLWLFWSRREPLAARQLLRLQRRVIERWEQEDMTLVCNAISVFFFPCKGPRKYLENKRVSRLKYQSNCINADPSADGGWAFCPRYCWKFHEVLRIQLMPFSHQTIPSAYIQNVLVLPLISTLTYCSSWVIIYPSLQKLN